jgi:cytochrome c biogenesis protein
MYKSTIRYLQKLSSLKLSFVGMASLLTGVLLSYFDQDKSVMWIAIPLLVLAINLLAAIVYNPRIRQNSGLLMFHICLLALALLASLSQLTNMKARVEIVQGQVFDSELMTIVQQGPWHSIERLQKIRFEQGDIVVEYAPGLRRGKTKSQLVNDNGTMTIGDNIGFKDSGYRFYTTSNKGYAAMLAWHSEDGQDIHGAIHFPSFPLYDWKQENQWTTPTGQLLKMNFVSVIQSDPDSSWDLNSRDAKGSLLIELANGLQQTLSAGQRIQLDGGELEFVAVRMWMGYSIFYNPWLAWFFAAAIVGVLGLAWHFYLKLGALSCQQPRAQLSARRGRAVPTV